ncbi:MAG TPA: hypothetical protein VFT02_09080 [Pyrinomonadaceae bacterium]|nr:hypothetical protein [Pyrinomonadaceae bacterium]
MSFFVNPALDFFERERGFREGGRRFDMNPVKHFAVLARGVMLKGVGLDVLYPNFIRAVGVYGVVGGHQRVAF